VFERGDQPGRSRDAVEFLEEGLRLGGGELGNQGNQSAAGTIFVGEQSLEDRGMLAEIFPGVNEERAKRVLALDGFDECFGSNGKQGFLGARRNHFIGIVGQDGENFGAIHRGNMSASAAYGDFAFAGSAAVAQFFENFRGESFHQEPA